VIGVAQMNAVNTLIVLWWRSSCSDHTASGFQITDWSFSFGSVHWPLLERGQMGPGYNRFSIWKGHRMGGLFKSVDALV